jgi:DNA oxidative demethylase
VSILQGFHHIPGYFDTPTQKVLLDDVRRVMNEAPLYVPAMPRSGTPLSVQMTNCGPLGWVTDRHGGYRYQRTHPATGRPWPSLPDRLLALWEAVSDYPAPPEACLVNYYSHKAKLGSHRDADEANTTAPVISVSLGDDAIFEIGGLKRGDARERLVLKSGDVVVLGGAARMAFHGVPKILGGTSDLLTEGGRINLTLRRVTRLDEHEKT